jgi:hypothetical protein
MSCHSEHLYFSSSHRAGMTETGNNGTALELFVTDFAETAGY